MRWEPVLALTCLGAVACDQPDKVEQLAAQCFMDQMGTHEQCNCMATEAKTGLEPELFDMFVTMNTESATSNPDALAKAHDVASSMTPNQRQQMATFENVAVNKCGLKR